MHLTVNDTFNKELPSDPIETNISRQVEKSCFSFVTPKQPSNPTLVHVSKEVGGLIGLSAADLATHEFVETFSGKKIYNDTKPYAMCYGGHQFGHWAGQLGDGRAINLMEVLNQNQRWALQLKGAGATPYSRNADGLAVLRSSIREHLCSEAMFHLGVPSTRSLSLILSGDEVLRDVLYNGNSDYEKGAIVCRVAPSFIRFGNFQILASRQDEETLKQLTDYTIRHFYTEIDLNHSAAYIQFFNSVAQKTLEMVLHWQRVGFVHGVMNTDNMSILGLTIDYGPYGWLEGYDANWTPNTTDSSHKRYRYGNQPQIALWNVYQLANALYPLVKASEPFETILNQFKLDYETRYIEMMATKLGIEKVDESTIKLVKDLENVLQLTETDMTIFFRLLADLDKNISLSEMNVIPELLLPAFYDSQVLKGNILDAWKEWLMQYQLILQNSERSNAERKSKMNAVNPKYVLRNYMAQMAIDAADNGDYQLIEELYQLLKQPYSEQPAHEKWFAKRPDWARNKVGCSMLSCSS
jgi:uncharacterized protein YdiU (UPF0061 family)